MQHRTRKPAKDRSIKLYLKDILDTIDKIIERTSGMDFETFSTNDILIDAIVRNIEIIGEAASVLPDELTSAHPEIQWKEVIGMRDHIVHGYFVVDINVVWTTITIDIPSVRPAIEKIFADIENNEPHPVHTP